MQYTSLSRASIVAIQPQKTSWWTGVSQGSRSTKSIFLPFWDSMGFNQATLTFFGIAWIILGMSLFFIANLNRICSVSVG